MADEAAAVILSAIEKLDSWLQLKKADTQDDDDIEKLESLALEKTPPDLCSLAVGMAELWEDNREKLYSLLVRVADLWKGTMKKAKKSGRIKEKVYSLVVELMGLWEDDDDKGKLHSLLLEVADPTVVSYEKWFSLVVEMVDLWEVCKGKLSKEKLNSWLANKADHLISNHKRENLSDLLRQITVSRGGVEEMEEQRKIWKEAEMAKNELRVILGILDGGVKKLEGLHYDHDHDYFYYFISDVVEMAHDVQLFVHVMDSDALILFNQIFNCFIKEMGHPLGKLWLKIMSIQEGLQETKKRMMELGDELLMVVPTPTNSDHVVGLKEDVELLLRKIDGHPIIYIKGMSGVGKTTLARELYNHPTVVDHYERRAWACFSSRELSRKQLLIELIQQLSKGFQRDDDMMLMEKLDNKSLRQMLHQQLVGNPYLIVLDHVSSDKYFDYFVKALLPGAKGSKLLLTTSIPYLRCDISLDWCFDHHMRNLDDDKSWELLLRTALSSDEEFPKKLEKKGREMLMRKCGGLPLAIKEVGKHWAEKRRSGSEWKQVVDSSIDMKLSATLGALESTYLNLDPEVKPCFLRLALFKEGTVIKPNKLLQIWNAGGLHEGLCEMVLKKLIKESILEVEYEPNSKTVKRCRINVVFHRLSITKAEDENNNRASHEPSHRVINCSRDKFDYNYSSANIQDEHLVTLFLHGGGCPSGICWNHFKRLEILDMEGFGLKILPERVGDLTELRYLGLRNNYIHELPQSLGRLKKLKVLDIAQNFMVEVADVIWEMDSLRHLYMSDISCWKPLKIDTLMNLETLTYISVDNWIYEVSELKNMMTSLRKLGIEEVDGNTDEIILFESLDGLKNLNYLILRGFCFKNMPSLDYLFILSNVVKLKLEGRLTRLPSANDFPPILKKLVLVNSCLDEDPMDILEKLWNLDYLKLQNAYTGQEMWISPHGFPVLCVLIIKEFWNLRNLRAERGAFARLRRLEINSCPYLDTLPEDIICYEMEMKMVTSKNIAPKIRELDFISRCKEVDIQP